MLDACIEKLNKIVWEYFGRKSYGDSFCSLFQKQWKFDRQMNWFFFPSIIGELPICNLGAKDHFERKFGQSCLDVSGCSRAVTGKDIPPVSLGVNQQFFLTYLNHGITYTGISMGVVLHGVPNEIGHFIITAIVKVLHGVKDTTLNGL